MPTSNDIQIFNFHKNSLNENRFSKTVELLIAYLCVKELKAFSASFGIKIKNSPNGGDFDCIANFQNQLVYFEVKSGKVSNIELRQIQEFLDRHNFLSPFFSVLFLDYEGGENKLDDFVRKIKGLKVGSYPISSIKKIIVTAKSFM